MEYCIYLWCSALDCHAITALSLWFVSWYIRITLRVSLWNLSFCRLGTILILFKDKHDKVEWNLYTGFWQHGPYLSYSGIILTKSYHWTIAFGVDVFVSLRYSACSLQCDLNVIGRLSLCHWTYRSHLYGNLTPLSLSIPIISVDTVPNRAP